VGSELQKLEPACVEEAPLYWPGQKNNRSKERVQGGQEGSSKNQRRRPRHLGLVDNYEVNRLVLSGVCRFRSSEVNRANRL